MASSTVALGATVLTLATRVVPVDYDLDRLSTEIRTLDGAASASEDATPADDQGRATPRARGSGPSRPDDSP